MENSYRYFENRACKYYPCLEVENDEMNCLFCFCPLYEREHCQGNPEYINSKGRVIKSCMHCTFPHEAENYDIIMQFLKKKAEPEKRFFILSSLKNNIRKPHTGHSNFFHCSFVYKAEYLNT